MRKNMWKIFGVSALLGAFMVTEAGAQDYTLSLSDEVGEADGVITVSMNFAPLADFRGAQFRFSYDNTNVTSVDLGDCLEGSNAVPPATICSHPGGDESIIRVVLDAGAGNDLTAFTGQVHFQMDGALSDGDTIDLVWDEGFIADGFTADYTDGSITIMEGPGGECSLNINPASHDFGTIGTGANASQAFTISNTGEADCTNLSVAVSGDAAFSLASSDCGATLGAGASCSATVGFSSAAEGSFMGSLDADADQDSAAAALSGAVEEGAGPGPTVAIPTMQPWGLALMALLMLMIGVVSVRTFRS